jgi:predicted MFS family arabinose efflux permease
VGWLSVRTLGTGAGALVLALLFVLSQARSSNPLVPLRIFRSRNVNGANLVRTLFPVALFGAFFLGALYLQHVLGYSALRTGIAFLPQSLTIGVFSLLLTGRIVTRFGAKATTIAGLAFAAGGLLLYARTPVDGSYLFDVLPALLLTGTGAGLVFMPTVSLAMAGAGMRDAGIASGMANVAIQMGAAVGLAVMASLSASRTSGALAAGASPAEALTSGYHLAFLIAAGCAVAAIVVALVVLRPAEAVSAAQEPQASGTPARELVGVAARDAGGDDRPAGHDRLREDRVPQLVMAGRHGLPEGGES